MTELNAILDVGSDLAKLILTDSKAGFLLMVRYAKVNF